MREVTHFIEEYLELTKYSETPTRFLFWGALHCLNTAMKDLIWLPRPSQGINIYPNMFTLILGDTSVVRKSTPFDHNTYMLSHPEFGLNNSKIITGTSTIEGVILTLSGAPKEGAISPRTGGSGAIIASEASAFLIYGTQTIPTLCDMYGYREIFTKKLAKYGNEEVVVKNMCFSMFIGSNETMARDLIGKEGQSGGLLGRCIVISETRRRFSDSGEEDHEYPDLKEAWKPMITFLRRLVNEIKGPIQWDEKARQRFKDWYNSFEYEKYYTGTGYEARLGTHVIKVAMGLAAAEKGFRGKLEYRHIDQAIQLCVDLIPEYKRLTFGSGLSPTADFNKVVAEAIFATKDFNISKEDLLLACWGDINLEQLDKVLLDMEAAKLIELVSSSNGPLRVKATQKFISLIFKNPNGAGNTH